jgi:hypothetical protein
MHFARVDGGGLGGGHSIDAFWGISISPQVVILGVVYGREPFNVHSVLSWRILLVTSLFLLLASK